MIYYRYNTGSRLLIFRISLQRAPDSKNSTCSPPQYIGENFGKPLSPPCPGRGHPENSVKSIKTA